jgi:hypothetical protein
MHEPLRKTPVGEAGLAQAITRPNETLGHDSRAVKLAARFVAMPGSRPAQPSESHGKQDLNLQFAIVILQFSMNPRDSFGPCRQLKIGNCKLQIEK